MSEPKTILVVEDEGVVARQLQLSLSDLGYRVPSTACSAEEAFQLAAEQRPDLVLMDIHLEGELDGIDAAAVLRERFDVPIIYLTAFADAATVEKAKLTEPYAYLVKPVDAAKLAGAVEVALHKHELDQRLRLSEAKFSGIVSISADAIVGVDDNQRIELFNDGAENIFGYSKSEVMGQPLDILLPERFRSVHHEHVQRFAKGPSMARRMGERTVGIVGRRKSGEEFPADASISKIAFGGRTLLTVVLRDISESKRIENEQRFLSELGAALSSTLDYQETLATIANFAVRGIPDICVLDILKNGDERSVKVASANSDGAQLTELIERALLDGGEPQSFWQRLQANRSVLVAQAMAEIPEYWVEHFRALNAADIKSMMAVRVVRRDQLLGALVFASTSETRPYSRTEVRLAEEVAHRAGLAIENAKLYRNAQRAIEARDSVLGIVAHDLRNPLNLIVIQSEILRRQIREAESTSHRSVETIRSSAKRMNRMIQDLLDVARFEAGRPSMDLDRLSPTEVAREAADLQKPIATESCLELALETAEQLPDIWGERDRLLQVFDNLIGNAIKFSASGGRITVGATPRDGAVLFWVADNGSGIAVDDVPHVFDRFWQANRKDDRRGAGLGLPIVKGIVEAHGGRVWVESRPGRGSTFFFTVPTATGSD